MSLSELNDDDDDGLNFWSW